MTARFRVALVGCGQMARVWLECALERIDTEVVALVDLRLESAVALQERYGLNCAVFDEVEGALRSSRANLVFDVTPPEMHESVTLTALAAGCDVFGEKPLASSLEAARRMVSAASSSGRLYAMMQNRRYLPGIRALHHGVRQGTLGRLGMLSADFFLAPHFGGFRDAMAHPLLLDMSIHTFDAARFISGADALWVQAHAFNPQGSWYAGAAAAVCLFGMSDGSVFSYRGSWCAEGLPTSWEAEWRAVGSQGSARWDGESLPVTEVLLEPSQPGSNREHRMTLSSAWNGREGHAGCLDELFSALLEGHGPPTVCSDNLRSLEMVFGAVQSAEAAGGRVQLGSE